jgi:RNA polymerase sigma-70 factor (ECF subfamily)
MTQSPEVAFARFRQSADAAALATAFDAVAGDLLRVAAFLLPRDEVEDAVHDTFVVAMTRSERYDAEERLLPWLLGILANEARMRRRRRRLQQRPLPLSTSVPVDPVVEAGAREVTECVAQALAALDRDESALLRLHLFEELSCREIGERLQRKAGTVRTQVSRAMSRLRQKLPSGLAGIALFGNVEAGMLAALRARVLATAAGMAAVAPALVPRSATFRAMATALVLVLGTTLAWLSWPAATDGRARRDDVAVNSERQRTDGPGRHEDALAGGGAHDAVRRSVAVPPATWCQRGLVHEQGGKPIPGARIAMRVEEFGAPTLATAITGPDGRYELDLSWWQKRPALDRSRFGLFTAISARGHHSSSHNAEFPPAADPAQPLEMSCDFELSAYVTLHGRVVDPDGRPVPARVTVNQGDHMNGLTEAEPDGTFHVVLCFEDKAVDVSVEAAHWSGCPAEKMVRIERVEDIDVGLLQLLPGNPLAGMVTLTDGTAFAGARVHVGGGTKAPFWHVEPETDARGRFTVVRPGAAPCRLFVLGFGVGRNSPEQEVPGEQSEVRIVVEGTLLALRWLDPAGNELLPQKALLLVFPPEARAVALLAQAGDPEAAAKAISSDSISTAQVVVPTGSHLLFQAGARGGLGVNQLVDVPDGGSRHAATLRFAAVPRAPLEVRIRFRDGGVPEEFHCRVNSAGHGVAVAEEVGREPGVSRWLAPIGPVQVLVAAYPEHLDDVLETFTAMVTEGGSNVCEAVLARRGRFALTLRDAGAPERFDDRDVSASVTVGGTEVGQFGYNDGDMEITSSEPPIGRRAEVLTMLPVGRYEVQVAVAGFEPVSAFVDVAEAKVAEVALLLTRKAQPPGK